MIAPKFPLHAGTGEQSDWIFAADGEGVAQVHGNPELAAFFCRTANMLAKSAALLSALLTIKLRAEYILGTCRGEREMKCEATEMVKIIDAIIAQEAK